MKRVALMLLPLLVGTPALGADLGPYYSERERAIEEPAPPRVVERERIIERHYYQPVPVYREQPVYVEPREYVYAPRVYEPHVHYRPYRYAYTYWRPHHFFPRRQFWDRHHRWW